MNMFRVSLILLCGLLLTQPIAAAQSSLDSIVAVVDESVVTERELADRIKLVTVEFNQSNRRLPKSEVLHRQVLEILINDSLLLQEANRRGIKITDGQLNQSMQRLARQNKLSLSDFRKALIRDGLNYDNYRETVRMEMTISTLGRQYSQLESVMNWYNKARPHSLLVIYLDNVFCLLWQTDRWFLLLVWLQDCINVRFPLDIEPWFREYDPVNLRLIVDLEKN